MPLTRREKPLHQTLTDQVLDNGNIELFNDRVAIDLINLSTLGRRHSRCAGAYVLNRTTGRVEVFQSRFVILATGGASKRSTCTRATRTVRPATALPWHGEQAVGWRIWN